MLIAIDPGLVTGIAGYALQAPNPYFWSEEVSGRFDAYDRLEGLIRSYGGPGSYLVVESYTITARTAQLSQQHDALKLIGVCEFLCRTYGTPMFLRPPSDKKFASNEKLTLAGFRQPSKGGHADDAARHLLNFLVSDLRHAPTIEAIRVLGL